MIYRGVCGRSLRRFEQGDEVGELLRSHLAHLADLLLKDEVVTWLAQLLVVHAEDFTEGWAAVADDVLVYLLGLGETSVGVDSFHVLSRPSS